MVRKIAAKILALRLITDGDSAFVQKILHIAGRQWKSDHHHGQSDNLRAGFEKAKRATFCHFRMLGQRPTHLKSVSSDSTAKRPCGNPQSIIPHPALSFISRVPLVPHCGIRSLFDFDFWEETK